MTDNIEREAFEHWMTTEGGYDPIDMTAHQNGVYVLSAVHEAWEGWQARTALAQPSAASQQAVPVAWMVLAANTRTPCEVTLYKSETEALRRDCVVPLYAAPTPLAPPVESPADSWAPERIWLQRGMGDEGSHTWCEDSQDEHEQAEYVRVDVESPAVAALSEGALAGAIESAATHYANGLPTDFCEVARSILSHAAQPQGVTDAARDVLAERQRHVEAEGWTPEHDDEHDPGVLASAATAYAGWAADMLYPLSLGDGDRDREGAPPIAWPWDREWWKPVNPRRALEKAGALILAEIERIDRAAKGSGDAN